MKKGSFSNVILILIFFVGLSLLLYPSVSDYWNSFTQTRAIVNYTEKVATLDNEVYDEMIRQAQDYNMDILTRDNPYLMSENDMQRYLSLLDVSDTGIMAYIEIPAIDCSLPIYHTVEDSVLAVAVGHIPWSALPVGGKSSHVVLSGHRGLPSAKLFTDLDRLVEGDLFVIRVLDEILTYQVDQIRIVDPQEVEGLTVLEDQDLCTLVTCTPYGINTHRLLVRGHRVENQQLTKTHRITADAVLVDYYLVAIALGIPMLMVMVFVLMLPSRKKR